jgi:DNA-binding protein Fis
MPKIYDTFIFFEEFDLLRVRLESCYPYVHKFVICEAGQTHFGLKKDFVLQRRWGELSKYHEKIVYLQLSEFPLTKEKYPKYLREYVRKLRSDSNEERQLGWLREGFQRHQIMKWLQGQPTKDAYTFVSDLDEIPFYEMILEHLKTNHQRIRTQRCHFYLHTFYYNIYNFVPGYVGGHAYLVPLSKLDLEKSILWRFGNHHGYHINLIAECVRHLTYFYAPSKQYRKGSAIVEGIPHDCNLDVLTAWFRRFMTHTSTDRFLSEEFEPVEKPRMPIAIDLLPYIFRQPLAEKLKIYDLFLKTATTPDEIIAFIERYEALDGRLPEVCG